MDVNSISGFTSQTRLTGLSGFDTETIIQELMDAARIPLDQLEQKRTLVEWKQAAYREISSSLIGFKSKYFDIVNRSTYLLSENSVRPLTATSSNEDYVSATAAAGAAAGTSTIEIRQLAAADKAVSAEGISGSITGSVDTEKLSDLSGQKLSITLDGVTKEITLGEYTGANLEEGLQTALDEAFGASKISVSFDGESKILSIDAQNGATKVTIGSASDTPPDGIESALSVLGLSAGDSNRISLNSTLSKLSGRLGSSGKSFDFDDEGNITFAVNGAVIVANENDTLEEVFDKINKSEGANATAGYDEITDRVSLVSKQTGAGDNLKIPGEIDPEFLKDNPEISGSEVESNTRDFFAALGIYQVTDEGQDAKVLINGTQELVRSANDFTVNGVTYHLNKAHEAGESETITVKQDTETVINNIKSFVEEYNKLIDTINGKVSESYDRDYQPLTDAEKEDMDEKDIEQWEEKAKTGILRNDSLLEKITLSMRKAIYEPVEGVNLTMSDIGIESKSYTDYGKLYLDEDKLKDALQNKPDEVTKLLNGTSEEVPYYTRDLTAEEREERYSGSGVFQRLADIIEDNISTKRDADGYKGALLVKAGIENDLSNTENLLSDELERYDDRIDEMIDKLTVQEENYYAKFSNLEIMLNQMNQQSAWITSQFGSGQ